MMDDIIPTFAQSFHALQGHMPPSTRWLWPLLRRATALHEVERYFTSIENLDNLEMSNALLKEMHIGIDFDVAHGWAPPSDGPLVVVANHPFGAIEGPVALSLLQPYRPDVRLVVNRAISAFPRLRNLVLPLVPRKPDLAGLRAIKAYLHGGGAILICPAGRVSQRTRRGLAVDDVWPKTLGSLITRSQATVIIMSFAGTNSRAFYLASRIKPGLGDLLLGREFLGKRGSVISVRAKQLMSDELEQLRKGGRLMEELHNWTLDLAMLGRRSGDGREPDERAP